MMYKKIFSAIVAIVCLIGLVLFFLCALAFCPASAKNNTLRDEAVGIGLALYIDSAGHRFAESAEKRNIFDDDKAKLDRIARCGPIDQSLVRLWMDSKELRNGTLRNIRKGYRLGMLKNTLDAFMNRGDFDPAKYSDEGHRKTAKNFVIVVNVVLPSFRIRLPEGVGISARSRKIMLTKSWSF